MRKIWSTLACAKRHHYLPWDCCQTDKKFVPTLCGWRLPRRSIDLWKKTPLPERKKLVSRSKMMLTSGVGGYVLTKHRSTKLVGVAPAIAVVSTQRGVFSTEIYVVRIFW